MVPADARRPAIRLYAYVELFDNDTKLLLHFWSRFAAIRKGLKIRIQCFEVLGLLGQSHSVGTVRVAGRRTLMGVVASHGE